MNIVCREKKQILHLAHAYALQETLLIFASPCAKLLNIKMDFFPHLHSSFLTSYLKDDCDAFPLPSINSNFSQIPSKSLFVLGCRDGFYRTFFALSHNKMNTSMHGTSRGLELEISYEGSLQDTISPRAVFVSIAGENLHETLQETFEMALKLTLNSGSTLFEKPKLPPFMGRLGWSSQFIDPDQLSHQKVLESIRSLKLSKIPIGYVILEEGWQHLSESEQEKEDYNSLISFEADPLRFPKRLKGLVEDLQVEGVQYVGVRHSLMVGPYGIHPSLAKKYQENLIPNRSFFIGKQLGKTFEFFYDFYGYLRSQGITFVKVADQGNIEKYFSDLDFLAQVRRNLHVATQAAAGIQLCGAPLHTECLRLENLFCWSISSVSQTCGNLASQSSESSMQSIWNNLTNSLWLSHLMQVDFDAWLTHAEHAESLAIFHALSGSLNVIGDTLQKRKPQLISKMIYPCGKLLKADSPLRLCSDSIFRDPIAEKFLYKAYTFKAEQAIIAVFNLSQGKGSVKGTLFPWELEGLKGEAFAVFSHLHGFLGLLNKQDTLPIKLKTRQSDVITLSPLQNGIAVLGFYQFFILSAPIFDISHEEDRLHIASKLAAPLLLYCPRDILTVTRNGETVPWEHDEQKGLLSIDDRTNIQQVKSHYTVTFED